jgi:glycosyltransferase involved in cell wall biosynthesis
MKTLSIVIPAFNEENSLLDVLETLTSMIQDIHEIIVVNDGSKDRTGEIAEDYCRAHPNVSVIHQIINQGKTEALKTGFAASTGDIVLVQDADMEYDPRDIPVLIEPIEENLADVVYGSRFLVRKAARVLYFRHYLANKFLTFLSNILTDINLSDVETGYKAFRGEIIRNMIIESSGFGFEIEVTAKVAKLKCRIYEVPISYHGRTYEEGKKIGFWDGFMAIFYILKFNLFRSLKSSYSSLPEQRKNRL